MGAQQSTRKLTLDNDDPTNVIKVSDAVVNRLKGKSEGKAASSKAQPTLPPAPQPNLTTVPPSPSSVVNSLIPVYMQEPFQTSLQVRQTTQNALKENDDYWKQRINQLEEAHEKINKLMEKEYSEAVEEVKSKLHTTGGSGHHPAACQDRKKALMACYKEHSAEPMRCANEVKAFTECVDKQRSDIISNRG